MGRRSWHFRTWSSLVQKSQPLPIPMLVSLCNGITKGCKWTQLVASQTFAKLWKVSIFQFPEHGLHSGIRWTLSLPASGMKMLLFWMFLFLQPKPFSFADLSRRLPGQRLGLVKNSGPCGNPWRARWEMFYTCSFMGSMPTNTICTMSRFQVETWKWGGVHQIKWSFLHWLFKGSKNWINYSLLILLCSVSLTWHYSCQWLTVTITDMTNYDIDIDSWLWQARAKPSIVHTKKPCPGPYFPDLGVCGASSGRWYQLGQIG